MSYKYNEIDYAKLVYEDGFQTKHIPTELRLVATYMRRYLGYKPKKLREEIYKFCSKHIPEYSQAKHYKVINRAISQATKKNSTLIKVDSIDIYDFEIDFINSLQICNSDGVISSYEYDCKKVIFTLLCLMKINKEISKLKGDEESKGLYFKGGNRKYNDLKKVSNISTKLDINNDIINSLDKCGIVAILFNGLIKLNFIEELNNIKPDNEKEVIENMKNEITVAISVRSFDNIGLYFDHYNELNKVKLCKYCDKPFRKHGNRQIYCSDDCSVSKEKENSKVRVQKHRKNKHMK